MSQPRHIAAIALGSNLGDRTSHLSRAVVLLAGLPGTIVTARGPTVCSAPMAPDPHSAQGAEPGGEVAGEHVRGGEYANTVVLLSTRLSPRALLDACHDIERACGRDRAREQKRWMARTLDLDLVLYDDAQIDEPGLRVPHPGLRDRPFVLGPLAAVWPGARVPPDGRTVASLWAELRARPSK